MTNIDSNAVEANSEPSNGRANARDHTSRPNARPTPSKSAAVLKLLSRARGATALELTTATDWQPHTVRAHLSGLRKKGILLVREARKSGESAYRVEVAVPVALVLTAAIDPCPLDAGKVTDAPTTSIVVA